MGKLLYLYQSDKTEYEFIILKKENTEGVFCLSPELMKLGDGLYIINIKSAQSYWKKIAQYRNETYLETLIKEIKESMGIESHFVLCHHPFEGLIFLELYCSKQRPGVYCLSTASKERFFPEISINAWIKLSLQLNELFEKESLLNKMRKKFPTRCRSLKRTLAAMGIDSLRDLRVAKDFHLERRYGEFFGKLWSWTFPEEKVQKSLDLLNYNENDLKSFPWIRLKRKDCPKVTLYLEPPVSHWSYVELKLKESFDKLLAAQELAAPNKILEIDWRLTLFDLGVCKLPISFKFPLGLQDQFEKEYSTLLVQFKFAFESLKEELNGKYDEIDYYTGALIIEWTLEVTKTINPAQESSDLLRLLERDESKSFDIAEFQNKVKNELLRFVVLDTNIHGLNYTCHESSKDFDEENSLHGINPFSLFSHPQKLSEEDILDKRFIERSSAPWWKSLEENDSYRDYYMCELRSKKIVFAFKDYKGEWFLHGIYS